jgi:hypothetical protein
VLRSRIARNGLPPLWLGWGACGKRTDPSALLGALPRLWARREVLSYICMT